MKKTHILFIVLMVVSIILPVNVGAAEISTFTVEHLADTIESSLLKDKILNSLKSSESDVVTLSATPTASGITLTYTKNGETLSFNYEYSSTTTRSIKYTLDTSSADADIISKVYIASFMQFWIYEASQYANMDYMVDNFSSSSSASTGTTESTTTCNIDDYGICITSDETAHKVEMEFLLSDLFAVKLNEELNVLTSVTSSIEAKEVSSTSVTLYPNTLGYKNDAKFCNIYRANEENGEYIKITGFAVGCDGTLGFKDDELDSGETYYYKAQYIDSKVFSSPIKVTTLDEEEEQDEKLGEKKYKNPETGTFANELFIALLLLAAITSVMVLKKRFKFYKI